MYRYDVLVFHFTVLTRIIEGGISHRTVHHHSLRCIADVKAKMYAISSDTHPLQLIKLHHFWPNHNI